jgi:hypothetical protein
MDAGLDPVAEGTGVQNNPVCDRHIVAYYQSTPAWRVRTIVSDMQHRSILHIATNTYADIFI